MISTFVILVAGMIGMAIGAVLLLMIITDWPDRPSTIAP